MFHVSMQVRRLAAGDGARRVQDRQARSPTVAQPDSHAGADHPLVARAEEALLG